MKKNLYIIPGWEDTCHDPPYQQLANDATNKGYEVTCQDIDWKQPLSEQIIAVPNNSVIFGFSLGAILACLIAQQYPCEHIILASMTPHYSFTDPNVKKALIELTGEQFIKDINAHLLPNHQARKQSILYGDLEEEKGDILVPNTEHELNSAYIREIISLL